MEQAIMVQTLGSLSLFQSVKEDTRTRLAELFLRVGEAVMVSPGDALLHQGDLGGETGFILLRGEVSVEPMDAAPTTISAPALLGEIQQFNPRAQRTATVRASGPVEALKFAWQTLYAKASEALSPQEQHLLMDALERSVCERLACETLADFPILRNLPDALRVRVALALHWVAQHVTLADGSTLFQQDGLCGAAGYLLTHGRIEIRIAGQYSQTIAAPNILGVLPEFDPDQRWTATATAQGDVELLKFNWLNYTAMLQRRLSSAEQETFGKAITASAGECFTR
jgi:CRP-like cAMP-binding protein